LIKYLLIFVQFARSTRPVSDHRNLQALYIKGIFHLAFVTLASICSCLIFDKQQRWNDCKSIASVKNIYNVQL